LRARGNVKLGDPRHIGDLLFADEEQDGESTKQQALVTYSYNWLFRDPWYFAATGSFERDPIRELDWRLVATGGIGRDIWDEARRALSVELGLGFSTEEIGDMSEDNTVASWVLRYRHDVLGGDLELFHNQSITTSIGGRSNTVVKTSTGVQYEISDLLYATLSLDFDYESEPAALAENEDVALLFGLGVEFE
jgi:putative salt-induced outer membrane protein YdiY